MSPYTKGLFAICIAAILWASTGSVSKLLFLTSPPIVVASHRFLLASLILLPFFLLSKKPKGYVKQLLPLGLWNTGNILLFYTGLHLSTANTALIIGTAGPLITLALSHRLIAEPLNKHKIIGVTFGFIGALYIVFLPILSHGELPIGNFLGNLCLVGSNICWSTYIIYSRKILLTGSHPAVLSTFINLVTVAVVTTVIALSSGSTVFVSSLSQNTYILLIVYAAVAITVITFFLFQWGVQYVSASTASLKEYLQLIVGVAFNALILGEKLTVHYFIGSICIIAGIFLATNQTFMKKIEKLFYFANSS
jgi:drug/metabolite transporter (DMT)-like permease